MFRIDRQDARIERQGAGTGPAAVAPTNERASTSEAVIPDDILSTLWREAAVVIVCRWMGATDMSPEERFYAFLDVSCEVPEVLKGPAAVGNLHFVWQVERGYRLPAPGRSEHLILLKRLRGTIPEHPTLQWAALDIGVLTYSDALEQKVKRLRAALK